MLAAMNDASPSALNDQLRHEILRARERVYHFGNPTPLEPLGLPALDIWVKREDLSPIKAYKWRGAGNRIATLSPTERASGVVTASAGNHAQGVALAARALDIPARIYMPRSTPLVKQQAVSKHGGDCVKVILTGDSYDDAMVAAHHDQEETGAYYVHAYDDLYVMAGQGTLADEIVLSGKGPFDIAYLQIGGGGMAAGVSEWLRSYWPDIELVGVEAEGQAAMHAAMDAQQPVTLDQLDLFCDGTAVRRIGGLPFQILQYQLDRLVCVTNDQVSHAIRTLWENLRCISEPSGALGLAAALQESPQLKNKRALVILCGANIDFLQLGHIASSAGAGPRHQLTLTICISERIGAMSDLLNHAFQNLDIIDFQYGKTDAQQAWPVFTLSSHDPTDLDQLPRRLDSLGHAWKILEDSVDLRFRAIPLRSELLSHPIFLHLEFYERPRALLDFLDQHIHQSASLCYFNYRQTGERIGRALIGIDFPTAGHHQTFLTSLPPHGEGYRLCQPLSPASTNRLMGQFPARERSSMHP